MEDLIQQIINKANELKKSGKSDLDIAKCVHMELGKTIYYDNNYSIKKDENGQETELSTARKSNMLKAVTDKSSKAQICKGMAEIYAEILKEVGIQARTIGVSEKGSTQEVSEDEAKHYYTVFKIGEQIYAQDYLIESALARIKVGEAELADEMPGICCFGKEYEERGKNGITETKLSNNFLKNIFREERKSSK